MRLKHFLSVFLTLLTLSVGQMWGTEETVTWTVSTSSANSVSKSSGTLPTGASASMTSNDSQTDKSQLTNGKKQTFTLTGMAGCTIKAVKVNMKKSNNGSSATVKVEVGSTTLQSGQSISLSTTAGDKSVTLANTTTVVGESQNVVITVTSNKNSAYVLKYIVTYEAPSNDPYTVSFDTGNGNPPLNSRTEASGGAGITLPSTSDLTPACSSEGWVLYGWTTSAYGSSSTTAAPTTTLVGLAGATYYPADNTTLHAVYKKSEGLAGTTMWSEDFTNASGQPSGPTTNGGSVYNSATVTYTCQTSYTTIYAQSNAGGSSPELLIPKSSRNGYFDVNGIPTGGETSFTLSYYSNSQDNLSVTTSTTGVTVGSVSGDANPFTRTITLNSSNITSFNLRFSMSTDANSRLDNLSVVADGTTYYWSAPTCTPPCDELGSINGSFFWATHFCPVWPEKH